MVPPGAFGETEMFYKNRCFHFHLDIPFPYLWYYFLFSEFFCRFIVMISHENLCLNHVCMPRRLCFELIFCLRNSVAQKEGQNFSDLALLPNPAYNGLPGKEF